jgi:hypothetical protein
MIQRCKMRERTSVSVAGLRQGRDEFRTVHYRRPFGDVPQADRLTHLCSLQLLPQHK